MGNSQSNMSHDLCDWCVAEDLRSARGIPHDYSATQAYLNYLRRNDELGRYQAVDILCRLQDPHYNINDGLYREIPSVPAIHGIEPFALPRERERDIPRLLSRDRPRTRQQRRQDRKNDKRHMPSRYRSGLHRSNSVESYLGRVRKWRASERPRPGSTNTSSSNAGSGVGLLPGSRSSNTDRNSNKNRGRWNTNRRTIGDRGNNSDWKKFPCFRKLWEKIKDSSREAKTNINTNIQARVETASSTLREKVSSHASPSSTATATSTPAQEQASASTPHTPKRSRWGFRRSRESPTPTPTPSTVEPQEKTDSLAAATITIPPLPLLPPSAPPLPQTPYIPKQRKWSFLRRSRGIPMLMPTGSPAASTKRWGFWKCC